MAKGRFASRGMKSSFKIYISDDFGSSSWYNPAANDCTPSFRGLELDRSVKSFLPGNNSFHPHGVWDSRWESPLKSWETLNLFSSGLNVGGNVEMH